MEMALALSGVKDFILILVVIALVASAAVIGLNDFNAKSEVNSSTYNLTMTGQEGLDNATSFLDIAGTMLGIVMLIIVIMTGFSLVMKG